MSRGDWVSDGRDVGSTVWPDAEVKVFLTASPEERARRRCAELAARGMELDEAQVLADVRRRDELDTTREASPLRVADGAVVIDSSDLDARDVADRVMSLVAALAGGGLTVADFYSVPPITRRWWAFGHAVLVPPIFWMKRMRVRGKEHVPATGPVLVVSNHVSQWDPPTLGLAARPRKSYYMAKLELFRHPRLQLRHLAPGGLPGGARRRGPARAAPGARPAAPGRRAADVPRGHAQPGGTPAPRAARRRVARPGARASPSCPPRSGAARSGSARSGWSSARRSTSPT